jgi:hypothetical protein
MLFLSALDFIHRLAFVAADHIKEADLQTTALIKYQSSSVN